LREKKFDIFRANIQQIKIIEPNVSIAASSSRQGLALPQTTCTCRTLPFKHILAAVNGPCPKGKGRLRYRTHDLPYKERYKFNSDRHGITGGGIYIMAEYEAYLIGCTNVGAVESLKVHIGNYVSHRWRNTLYTRHTVSLGYQRSRRKHKLS
jgi:hypothetical protein